MRWKKTSYLMSYMDPDTLTLATFIFHLARPAMMALANKLEEKDEKMAQDWEVTSSKRRMSSGYKGINFRHRKPRPIEPTEELP